MSVTPRRPSSSAQSARRVSFSPVVNEILDSVEKRRDRSSRHIHPANEPDNEAVPEKNPSEPSTTSHRARLAAGYSPARRRASDATPPPSEAESHATTTATTTTTVEFSLKDIPLDGKMAPPVWREPSPGRSCTSRRVSPARGGTPMSARLSNATSHEDVGNAEAPSSARRSNPYTDVARDSTNLLRRQRVVRTFFASHEDAVRLYIRLQQLLTYRDLCHHEFQQRLQFLNSEEERQAAVAARAQRVAAQEKEIQRIQAALAHADVTSPEFASSMNSLYSTGSGTPSERSARREAMANARVSPAHGRGTETAGRVPVGKQTNNEAKGTTGTDGAADAGRPPCIPRHATPKEALAAWRRSLSQDKALSAESASLDVVDATPRAHRGFTPRDSVTSSNLAAPQPGSTVPVGAVATVVPVPQGYSPPPRRAAPFGNTDSDVLPPSSDQPAEAASNSLPSSVLTDTKNSKGEAARQNPPNSITTASSATVDPAVTRSAAPVAVRAPLPLPSTSPESKTKSKTAVAGFVTPPRAAHPLQSDTTAHSTDSPLARFRKQRGYNDPVEHFRARLSNHATPLHSQSSLGSATGSPPRNGGSLRRSPEAQPTRAVGEKKAEEVTTAAAAAPAASSTNTPPAETEKAAVGPGTALLLASERTAAAKRPPSAVAPPNRHNGGETSPASSGKRSRRTPSPAFKAAAPTRLTDVQPDTASKSSTPEDGEEKPTPSAVAAATQPLKDAVAALAANIQSWSPADPPLRGVAEDEDKTTHSGLVSSLKGSPSPAESRHSSRSREGRPPSLPRPTTSSPEREKTKPTSATTTATTAAAPPPLTSSPGHSIWDEIAALERRVGGLEGRTAELERAAAKRAVLDAIRLLRERVTLLEERTTILERDEAAEATGAGHLQWRGE